MYSHGTYYKSLVEYDLDRLIDQRKNLVQVQSVLSLYDKNNQNLVDQVNSLIQQNQLLKTQIRNSSPKRLKQSSFTNKSSNSEVHSYLESQKSTLRKQRVCRYTNKLSHPRNVYMAPLQVQMLNRKLHEQAKNTQKKYDILRGCENFKQKLNQRKQQLKRSYARSSRFQISQVKMKENPYIEEPSLENNKKQPLKESNRPNIKISPPETPHLEKKAYEQVKMPSPYEDLERSDLCYPSEKFFIQTPANKQDTHRSSSAIKVQNIYPSISIKIQQPRTKWENLSSTYFSKSKFIKNDQNEPPLTQRKQCTGQIEKNTKSKKKRFLNVISQSISAKVIQKGQQR